MGRSEYGDGFHPTGSILGKILSRVEGRGWGRGTGYASRA
ncbi:hypothetical protein CKA32_006282 [Geitlerinema sp. FC II]|nr:hypothetical protein CKA32_006282 [Geitlerinema sp. FC II]